MLGREHPDAPPLPIDSTDQLDDWELARVIDALEGIHRAGLDAKISAADQTTSLREIAAMARELQGDQQ